MKEVVFNYGKCIMLKLGIPSTIVIRVCMQMYFIHPFLTKI